MKNTYRKLRGRIVEKFGSISAFAKEIELSRQSISNKLNQKADFSRNDMKIWCDALDIDEQEVFEYFF